MSSAVLEPLFTEVRHAFVIAKADNKLEVSEIIRIAVVFMQRLQKIPMVSDVEKKMLVLLSLKMGLDASGGVDSLFGTNVTTPETNFVIEDQMLKAVMASVDLVLASSSGKLDMKKSFDWRACVPLFLSCSRILPKGCQDLLSQAATFAKRFIKDLPAPVASVVDSVVTVVEPVAPASPAAVAPASPAPVAAEAPVVAEVPVVSVSLDPASDLTSSTEGDVKVDLPGAPAS
jgi:hypothetical protein